ncbi:putative disease resistance protein RGA4 [Miscanthus floridulus]|uniref:putative disease resistance protein RGA4 n=1 Tax=Miscanthus floridulus TaxID=154761 RepID=UPI00345AA06E
MAAILDAMGPYVMQLIADMATEEVKMMLGISGDIEKQENNMESIKCFLADAERKRITELRVQRWVQKLKNAMYDATDILDLCQIKADKQRESKGSSMVEKAPGCCRPLLSYLRNPVFTHKIGSRIKELNQRLDNIYEEAHKFNFINLVSHPEQRMPTGEKVTSEFVESAIVGEKIERETRELVQMLTINGHHDIKVVAIVGTGGMGKTTLAQKIFNETTVQGHFKVKIWLSITQHFDEVHGTDHLKVVGMKIISKCGGLPLAIKVMGGLLSTKPRSESDWEAVLKHHAWSVAGLPKELDNAIYLSYEDLSPQLKQCFLYCSLFPKGTTIWRSEVVPMWISEGFIHPPDRSTSSYDDWLEEIAEGYYQELITRNLIERATESALTRYSCTMHDVVRSFAEFMSKEESLVVQDHQDDGGSKISHNGGTGWCSLEEIGPLSQLRELTLHGLENVPASSSAGMAMISSKEHLHLLALYWSSSGFMGLRDETNKQQQQRVVEEGETLHNYFRKFMQLKAKAPYVPDEIAIEAAIKGLQIGPFAAHLARKKPTSIQQLYDEFEKYYRSDNVLRKRLEEQGQNRQQNSSKNSQKSYTNQNASNQKPGQGQVLIIEGQPYPEQGQLPAPLGLKT